MIELTLVHGHGARPEQSLSVEAHDSEPAFPPLRERERRCGTLRRLRPTYKVKSACKCRKILQNHFSLGRRTASQPASRDTPDEAE